MSTIAFMDSNYGFWWKLHLQMFNTQFLWEYIEGT